MTVVINGTTGISGVDGSASTPAVQGSDTNTGIFFPAADTIAFGEGGTEAMRIDSSGRVGIGTSSPSSKLHVAGSNGDGLTISGSGATGVFRPSAAGVELGSSSGDNTVFLAGAASEKARITSGGALLVGTTNTSGTAGNGFKVINSGETVNVVTAQSQNADRSTYEFYSTGASAYRFYVGAGGTVYATNTTISSLSDIRHKENVRDLDVGLDAVMTLKPRKFDWKEGKGKNIKDDRGFIAQEFEQVFPDLIDEWKDPAPEGEEPYKSVRADLIPVLVKAIQELNAKVETLEAQNAAFEARLAALEAK